MKIINNVLWFLGGIFLFVELNIIVTQDNPCSTWAKHPSACHSDILQNLGK
jgi:hypothetical protein